MRALSPRLGQLRERFEQRYAALGTRLYTEPEEAAAAGRLLLHAWRSSIGQPPILRRAVALEVFAEGFPVRIEPGELIIGSQAFNPPRSAADYPAKELAELGYAATTGHIVHDYETLVQRGICGLHDDITAAEKHHQASERAIVAEAFDRALLAFRRYIERHAEVLEEISARQTADVRHIADKAPRTFAQALQLVWFAQIFLHAENPSMAISFGRLDQILWPFLQRDLTEDVITEEAAFELVGAFCLKCCEGEESQNLTLGGTDVAGRDAANPLSVMLVEAVLALQCHQPSLTVRWTQGGGEALKKAACQMAAGGGGQPGFMNDAVVQAALAAVDIPMDRAADWAVVGCYEATPQGDSYPNTVLGGLHLPQAITEYLQQAQAGTFGDFLEGFYSHLHSVYAAELARVQRVWDDMARQAPSPFGSLLSKGCVAHLVPLEAGGTRFNLVGINILGLGTLIDSLHAVRTVVYEQRQVSLAELAGAVVANFPDETLRTRLLHLPGRYGTDTPATNHLAADVSTHIARMVLDSRLTHGVRPYPAFFRFTADIRDLRTATHDGRRCEDLISYGAGPASCIDTTPTAILRSTAAVAHHLCACGAPLAMSLPRSAMQPEKTAQLIYALVDTYFTQGGMHVHFNTPSAADLREAQERPEHHQNLLIRISGFSARFVRLDRALQQALIERTERGL